jgi:predicted branched-subunit amino acid permease
MNNFGELVVTLALLIAAGLVIYGPWHSACTDWARETIFEKRAAIFDLAVDGDLDFEATEYKVIRSSLEKSIRFAHVLTWPRFAFWFLGMKRGSAVGKSELSGAIEQIDDPVVRRKVGRLANEAQFALLKMVCAKSPVLSFLIAVFWVSDRARNAFNELFAEAIQVEAEKSCEDLDLALAA